MQLVGNLEATTSSCLWKLAKYPVPLQCYGLPSLFFGLSPGPWELWQIPPEREPPSVKVELQVPRRTVVRVCPSPIDPPLGPDKGKAGEGFVIWIFMGA